MPQVDELIDAARVPVFLLDERQVVRPGEIGTLEQITEGAERRGAKLELIRLDGQFRAAGSEAYIEWVDSLLRFDGREPKNWIKEEFELRVADSPG
jgi:uncharacterized protein